MTDAPEPPLEGTLVAYNTGPGPHHKPKQRLEDPYLQMERERVKMDRAYGLTPVSDVLYLIG